MQNSISFRQTSVNIAFICDNDFVMPTCVAIISLLKNREQCVLYCIFIIAVDLLEKNVNIFKEFESVGVVDIIIIRKTAQNLKYLHTFDNKSVCVASISALLKFVLPNTLPNLDKVLYIDGDVIIQKGLLELYNNDIKDFYAAVVKDSGRIYYIIKGTEHLKNYFNSGVLLLNLKKLRQESIPEILIKTKKNLRDSSLMDQNVFNIVFKDKVRFLDIKYNFLYVNLMRSMTKYTMEDINEMFNSNYKDLDDLKSKAYIVHFSSKDKPWKFLDVPFGSEWYKYYLQSPFKNKKLNRVKLYNGVSKPVVSVIIPIYNTEKYLHQCLDSVVNQTLKDIEIICINDGSTDSSLQILNEYASKDVRIKVINQKHSLQGKARNRGLSIVRSPYIMFLDSDDWIEPETLEILYDTIYKNDVDIVYGAIEVVAENDTFSELAEEFQIYYNSKTRVTGLYKFDGDFYRYRTSPCCILYKMSIIKNLDIRFPEGIINEDEAWFWYYLCSMKPNVYFVNRPFYKRLLRENSTMTQLKLKNSRVYDIIDVLRHIYFFLKERDLLEKYKLQYRDYFLKQTNRLLKTLHSSNNRHLYKKAKSKIKKLSRLIYGIDKPKFLISNEDYHKVINILGVRIKLRKERLLKFRKNITAFLENIICIKNDGIYKVIGIFRIKVKIKRRHKELLAKLKEQEKSIKNLKDEIKNIVLSQPQDFKKELINKTDSVKKQFSDTLITHKDEIKNIVLSQSQDFKKELINICKNNEHLNYTQLESLFWLSKRLKIKNSLPPMRNWAMSPDVLLKLHEYITNAKPKIVLEFGSGVSTVVICDALSQNNSGRLISIEHLEKFMKETMEVIKNENLSSFLDLRLAQLKIWTGEHLSSEKPVFWYDEKIIDTSNLKEIDLLIIDGPPGNTNPYSRYPALPILYKNLSNKAQVWLDDTNRKDEATIANTYAEKYKLISNFFNLEKGLVVLEKSKESN